MAKVSILIPARNEPYLSKTVDDLFAKATGEIEVLVLLDGWKPETPLKSRPNLKVIWRDKPYGTRNSINNLVREATGKYIMRTDAHCMYGPGFDEILQKDLEDNWLATPSRYSLDPEKWQHGDNRIEYLYLTYPYVYEQQFGLGFHGKKWIGKDGIGTNMGASQYYYLERERQGIPIDNFIAFQGSLWFTTKQHYIDIDGVDEVHCYHWQEPQEIVFKTWLRGGRCIVNKNTWYAHWHKTEPSNYGFRSHQKHETERFSTWMWMNDKWPKAKMKFEDLVEKFWPMPGWPNDWKSQVKDDNNFTVFDYNGRDGFLKWTP